MFNTLKSNKPLMRLFACLPPYKGFIFLALVAMIISAASSSLMALLLGKMTDLGFYQKNGMVAIWAPIALIGVSMMHSSGQFVSAYLLQRVSQSVLVKLRDQLFDRMIRWPDETVQKQQSGVVVSKFINEGSLALGTASEVVTVLIRDSLQVIALLAILLWHNWQLTLITLVVAPFLLIVLLWVSKRMKMIQTRTQQAYGEMLGFLSEVFQAQRLVKIYNEYDYEKKRFSKVNNKLKGLAIRAQIATGLGTPTTQLITMTGVAIVVFVALIQAQHDMLSFPEFVTYISAMLLMTPAIKKLSALNGTTAKMSAAATSLFAMMDIPTEKDPGTREIERINGDVEFRDVNYRYPNVDTDALHDFSLQVKAGQMIALVGASGAGKTTVINLIPRFLVPASGEILFDGISQNEMTLASIRNQISMVTQDVIMFDDTIAANIAYGAGREASEEEIRKVSEAAYLMPLINSLPDGFNTIVGEKGSKLSGGQKQRISIARALLKNAPILLLDEATSALDTESEKYIQASLEKLQQGRTSFVVAHRLSTIIDADLIVVIDDGRIIETGTHTELLAKGGAYAKLYEIQFGSSAKTLEK